MIRSLPSLYNTSVGSMLNGLLKAWSSNDEQIEIDLQTTKEQLFVTLASGRFLDNLGNNVGVNKDPSLNISDNDFRKLIPTMSFLPKQLRKTLIELLEVFWGPLFVKANVTSSNVETFNFGPQTALSGVMTFEINNRTVLGSGTSFLSELSPGDYIKPTGSSGIYYSKVSAILDNNTLILSTPWNDKTKVNTTAVLGTTHTLDYIVDKNTQKTIRFIPNAFSNLNAVTIDELTKFINSNVEHNTLITASTYVDPILGSKLNIRTNTPGLQGAIQITGGTANDITRRNFTTINQEETKCKIIEINPNEVVVQIPSSVPILRRSLKGAAHPRDAKARIVSNKEPFDFSGAPTSNLTLTVEGTPYTILFTNSTDFQDPTNVSAAEVVTAISKQLSELYATSGSTHFELGKVELTTNNGNDKFQITGGTANTILGFPTTLNTDPAMVITDYPSPYIYSINNQEPTVTGVKSEISSNVIAGDVYSTINLSNAASFPNKPGLLMFDFGRSTQEGPVAYSSRPNNSTLLIDASHQFQFDHLIGRTVNLVVDEPSIPRVTGEDYAFFVTGTEQAREAAQKLIKQVLASGVVIRFIIDYPEYLFGCNCADCEPSESSGQRGSRTALPPLNFD